MGIEKTMADLRKCTPEELKKKLKRLLPEIQRNAIRTRMLWEEAVKRGLAHKLDGETTAAIEEIVKLSGGVSRPASAN